jgi:hypothetical protein
MMELLGRLPDALRGGLDNVIAGALAGGAPEPSWVAADDGSGAWVAEVAGRPAAQRVRGVVAAASADALVTAQRLAVGGAMWLPPSSLAAIEAFGAAGAAATPEFEFDPAVVETLGTNVPIRIVSFGDREFWRVQLGDRALAALLAELAAVVGAPAAILPWPALLVSDRLGVGASDAWQELASRRGGAVPDLIVTPLTVSAMGEVGMVLDAAYTALLEGVSQAEATGSISLQPVHELPQGCRVGWWARECGETPAGGWLATPSEMSAERSRWALSGEGGAGTVEEVLRATEVAEAGSAASVRVPGWACGGLRSGTPAGLLVARLAEEAKRRGLPLWIPNLDDEGLRFALGLPGRLWVDGPAVPD